MKKILKISERVLLNFIEQNKTPIARGRWENPKYINNYDTIFASCQAQKTQN